MRTVVLVMAVVVVSAAQLSCVPQNSDSSSNLSVASLELVDSRRVGRSRWEYTYAVAMTNPEGSFTHRDVTASFSSSSPNTSVEEGLAFWDVLEPGTTSLSSDTITISHDRSVPFFPSDLYFSVESTVPTHATEFLFFFNSGDSAVANVTTNRGELIRVFGTKEATGELAEVTGYYYKDADDNEIWATFENEQARSFNVSGYIIDVGVPDQEGTFTLVITTPDGQSASVRVGPGEIDTSQPVSAVSDPAEPSGQAQIREPFDWESWNASLPGIVSPATAQAASSAPELFVRVSTCGIPEEAAQVQVKVDQLVGMGFPDVNIWGAQRVGPGLYRTILPGLKSTLGEDAQELCDDTAAAIAKSCNIIDALPTPAQREAACIQGGLAIEPFIPTPGEGVAAAGACIAALESLAAYCAALNNVPPGADSIPEYLCKQIGVPIDTFIEGTVTVSALAKIWRNGRLATDSDGYTQSNVITFPDINLNIAAEDVGGINFTRNTTVPFDPAPGQSYVYQTELICAPQSSTVRLSISGTDGYSDMTSCAVAPDVRNSCELGVPGAEESVVDTLRATVDGEEAAVSRTIVF